MDTISDFHFIRLNSSIFRANQIHLDKILKKFHLSSGSYPYLMILNRCEGISQNKISCELGQDKAMSARTITKLIELGYIYKEQDENDSRAYKLYLTENAKIIIPKVKSELYRLIEIVTEGLDDEERRVTNNALGKILINIKNLNIQE